MDEDISRWILEFLLRKPIDERTINRLLSSLPIPSDDHRLQKTILLRRIDSETSNGSITEKLLDFLEFVEQLDENEGKMASEAMKLAYCAVAVDCTVRYLDENLDKNANYFEAVQKVWRNRVCKMQSLSSEELISWSSEIEAAIWDSHVCGKLLMKNTRNEALNAVRVYLAEAWESMGPTFLEVAAEKVGNDLEGLSCGGGSGGGGGDGSGGTAVLKDPCSELVSVKGDPQKAQAPLRRKHVARKSRPHRCPKISDDDDKENEDAPMNKANGIPNSEVDKVQETSKCASRELNAAVRDPISDALVTDNTIDETIVRNKPGPELQVTSEVNKVHKEASKSSSQELHVTVSDPVPDAHQTAMVTDNPINDNVITNETRPEIRSPPEVDRVQDALNPSSIELTSVVKETTNVHESPEVERVREALKSSSMELRATVTDPLPEALRTAHTLSSTVAPENQTRPETHPPRDDHAQGKEVQNLEEREKQNLTRPSLMEPNGTGRTLDWDDSIDNISKGSPSRPHLPSPKKRKKPSPLKKIEDVRFVKRRVRKKWTPAEEDSLRDGVEKFGKGNWKFILNCYRDVFQDRTEVDLKDKWRNMVK